MKSISKSNCHIAQKVCKRVNIAKAYAVDYSTRAAIVAMSLLMTACATNSPMPTENKASVEHSKVYVERFAVVSATSRDSRLGACAVPAGLKGANTGAGESKVWKDLVGRADTCVNERNWPVLESLANEMSKADLDNPWPAYFLSVAAEARGDLSRSMWMTELANKKSGGKVALFIYQRGRVWMKMSEKAKAMTDLQNSVTMEPSLVEGQLFLAQVFNRDQDFGRAEGYYRAALKFDDKNYAALTALGEIDLAKGSSKNSSTEAADFFARATAANPNALYPWLRLSYIYESLQKNPELALNTYKSMKSKVDAGAIHEKPDFDVNARIKTIEEDIRARQPAADGKPVASKANAKVATSATDMSKSKKAKKDASGDAAPAAKADSKLSQDAAKENSK